MRRIPLAGALAIGGLVAAGAWWRRNPSACPYGQRFLVEVPRPLITRPRLRQALAPQAGETVLEVGPGTGYYALPVAEWLGPEGRLHVLDIQQAMLDHTMRAAAERSLADRVIPRRGDARELPYADGTFDAAYLITVLGEIPDQDAALAELCRVLKPDGRLVVGEIVGDPHMVGEGSLRRRAEAAGLRFERRVGSPIGFFAVLRRA